MEEAIAPCTFVQFQTVRGLQSVLHVRNISTYGQREKTVFDFTPNTDQVASTSTPTMSYRECIPSAAFTNDTLCLNAGPVSSAFEVQGQFLVVSPSHLSRPLNPRAPQGEQPYPIPLHGPINHSINNDIADTQGLPNITGPFSFHTPPGGYCWMQHADGGKTATAASGQGATPDSYGMPQPSILPGTHDGSVNPLHHIYDSNSDHNSSNILLFEQCQPSEVSSWPASSTDSTVDDLADALSYEFVDTGKQLQHQERSCAVCNVDRMSHHLEQVFPLKKGWACKW